MTRRAVIIGVGHYLPERVVENAEFEAKLETTDEWIRSRSGIERRHFAAEGETTSILASHAQLQAQTQLMAAYENRLDPTAPQQHIDYNLQMLISTETITHGIPLVF